MIALETVVYWPRAFLHFESTWTRHKIPSFETWVTQTYNCRLSFSMFETSAAFVFDNEQDATAFILKFG
jgi:hypothetical protein